MADSSKWIKFADRIPDLAYDPVLIAVVYQTGEPVLGTGYYDPEVELMYWIDHNRIDPDEEACDVYWQPFPDFP